MRISTFMANGIYTTLTDVTEIIEWNGGVVYFADKISDPQTDNTGPSKKKD